AHEAGGSPRPGTGSTVSSGSSASGPSASMSALSRCVTSVRSSGVTGSPRAAASAPTCSRVRSLTERNPGIELSAGRAPQHLGRNLARDELAVAAVGYEAAVFHDDASAQDRGHRPALDRPAFPGAVVADVKVLARE